MIPFVKICGITNPDDAFAACDLGADMLGFIFYARSPRYITPVTASIIIGSLPTSIQPVGVFVNQPLREIQQIIDHTGIQIVQLHGSEPPEAYEFGDVRVWKAVRPVDDNDISLLERYTADAFLVDTFDKELFGGTGRTGNWNFAREAAQKYTIILSGGLNPDNINEAIATVQPAGVDINSGVEAEPGKKDHRKLKDLFNVLHDI
jgi:phosphoribosylanthranilate isomerase